VALVRSSVFVRPLRRRQLEASLEVVQFLCALE
jgi:hypothetical protein